MVGSTFLLIVSQQSLKTTQTLTATVSGGLILYFIGTKIQKEEHSILQKISFSITLFGVFISLKSESIFIIPIIAGLLQALGTVASKEILKTKRDLISISSLSLFVLGIFLTIFVIYQANSHSLLNQSILKIAIMMAILLLIQYLSYIVISANQLSTVSPMMLMRVPVSALVERITQNSILISNPISLILIMTGGFLMTLKLFKRPSFLI